MNVENLYRAIGTVDGDLLERCETAVRRGGAKSNWLKWAGAVACFGLIVTVAIAALPGILKGPGGVVSPPYSNVPGPAVSDGDNHSNADSSQSVEPGTVQVGDTRAEKWLTAEELGLENSEGIISSGLAVPIFISYQGGFYGVVGEGQLDNPRFAPSESENLLFNTHYTHTVYLVEGHTNCIAIHINGMEVYEKIFDVTFVVDGTTYAIAYSPVMNADSNLGDVVLETEDYTVYEAVKLQGEPARCVEYIVDILPLLQRERPNLFDGSDLEPDGYYREQWQLALPLE